jgi:hypothetical protein
VGILLWDGQNDVKSGYSWDGQNDVKADIHGKVKMM